MTSNLGSDLIKRDTSIGFTVKTEGDQTFQQNYDKMREKVMGEVKRFFRPEFLNRIDSTVVFHALTREHILEIVDLMLAQVTEQVKEKNIYLEVTKAARRFLAEKGYDPDFGARPLRRTIQDRVEDSLSENILANKFAPWETVIVDVEDGEIAIRIKETAAAT